MFHRDDVYGVLEALAAEVAHWRRRRELSVGLVRSPGFVPEPPLVARIPLLRAGHERNRYWPQLAVSTARLNAKQNALADATIRQPNYPPAREAIVRFERALNAAILMDSDRSEWRNKRLQRSAQPAS
jgi:hypothetical protein